MKKIINMFDLYAKSISLYIRSSSKASTCFGFICTIISFLFLCLILYFECYEVFKREHPSVVSFKQNINKNNSTLSISNNTFNFFINFSSDFEKDKLLTYFRIVSYIKFQKEEGDNFVTQVSYEPCNSNDKLNFQKYFKNFEFSKNDINLCPRINFNETEKFNLFYRLIFYFDVYECTVGDPQCTVDKELYQKIREKQFNFTAQLNFIDSEIDLTNYDDPYWFKFQKLLSRSSSNEGIIIQLEGSEIYSQAFFSYNTPTIQSQFREKRVLTYPKNEIFASFVMTLGANDMYIYKRVYKTLNSAFATSFAIFKIFNLITSILLNPLYTYYLNTTIIKKFLIISYSLWVKRLI
jgi:hypothetical protein